MRVRYTCLMTARRQLIRLSVFIVLTLAGLVSPRESGAEELADDESREIAVRHHFQGRELFREGRYAEAAIQFEAAQRLAPAPSNLFNLARCYLRLGRIQDALEAIESFLAQELPDERRREGEAMQIALRDMAEGVAASEPEGGEPEPMSDDELVEQREQDDHPEAGGASDEGAAGEPDEPGDVGEPVAASDAGRLWTGAFGLGAGASLPVPTENIGASAALVAELSGGVMLGRSRRVSGQLRRSIRLELVVEVALQPHTTGYLIEISGGPRVGFALGNLPLWLEVGVGVGAIGLEVDEGSNRQIADGSYWSLVLTPSVSLVWQPLRWLEIVVRPVRVELTGLSGEFPGGFALRWGLDGGLRFRL
jgi:hypothetical protein